MVALLIGVLDGLRAVVGVDVVTFVASSLSGDPESVLVGPCVSLVGG